MSVPTGGAGARWTNERADERVLVWVSRAASGGGVPDARGGPWLEAQRSKQTRSGERACFGGGLTANTRGPCGARRVSLVGWMNATAMDWATATRGTSAGALMAVADWRLTRAPGSHGGRSGNNEDSAPAASKVVVASSGVPLNTRLLLSAGV